MEPVSLKFTILIAISIDAIIGVPLRRDSRSSYVDWTNYNSYEPQGRGSYAFGYDVEDPETNNIQFRDEERLPNGTVTGSYGYLRPDGLVHIVHYVADDKGYRASVENNQRGQLKPFFDPQGSSLSPAMASALQTKKVYKRQKVHEQRLRPIDRPKETVQLSQFLPISYEEQINNADNSDFHEALRFENNFLDYYTPYRFLMNRT